VDQLFYRGTGISRAGIYSIPGQPKHYVASDERNSFK
jgi:hypothetical protein